MQHDPTITNQPWALCMAREDAAALGALRLVPGLEVAEAGSDVWLRGQRAEEKLIPRLLGLPAMARYEWKAPDHLRRLDQRIASHRLPLLRWQPLDAWLRVELPAAAFPASEPAPVALRLVRSGEEHTPDMLLTSVAEFRQFTLHAARVRLERLSFAASAQGEVLVRGVPLPPLPGARFVLHDGVAVPAGFGWAPAVSKDVLARRFGASNDAPVLWNADGTLTRFHSEQFVPASRSAVLATEEGLRATP